MIPTLAGTGDIPQGPERPEPMRVPPPALARSRPDEFEALQRTLRDLQTKVERLETRVSKLEAATRNL